MIWKIFFSFDFHILPQQIHIGDRIFIKNVLAVAAYSRLASRSQAKFQTMKLSPLSAPRAAAPAQSTISTCRSLRFSPRSCSDVNLTRTVPVAFFPEAYEARSEVIWWLLTCQSVAGVGVFFFHVTFDIKRLLFRLVWRVVRCLSTKQDDGTTWPIFDGCSTPDRTARLHGTGRLHSVTGSSRPGPAGWRLGREARLKFPTRRRMTGHLGGWRVSRGARLGSEWRARGRGRPGRRGWPSTWWLQPSRHLLTQHMMLTTQHMLQKRSFNFLPSGSSKSKRTMTTTSSGSKAPEVEFLPSGPSRSRQPKVVQVKESHDNPRSPWLPACLWWDGPAKTGQNSTDQEMGIAGKGWRASCPGYPSREHSSCKIGVFHVI